LREIEEKIFSEKRDDTDSSIEIDNINDEDWEIE